MSDNMKTFICPNCKNFINSSMAECKFCGMELDFAMIEDAVKNQEKVDKAYNSASKTRIMSGAMVTFFLLSLFTGFVPALGFFPSLIFSIGFYIMFLGIPIVLIVWAIRFGGLKTFDAEYKTAKKYIWTTLFIWLAFPVVYIIFAMLALLGIMAMQNSR